MNYEYVPPDARSKVDHVGTYKRRVPVSLERMYENAIDWAHLSHLHETSFADIECIDAGAWGWHAAVTDVKGRRLELELRLDRGARRWITRNLSGPTAGAEIWTHVFEVEPRLLDLVIDFFIPGVPQDGREKVGLAYARSYERLYDEDVWMMSERQQELDRRVDSIDRSEELRLAVADLDDPMPFSLSGRDFVLTQKDDAWFVYPARCPHQLGPLGPAEGGQVKCPWHGFTFDVESGERTDGGVYGGQCRFGQRPVVVAQGSELILRWST